MSTIRQTRRRRKQMMSNNAQLSGLGVSRIKQKVKSNWKGYKVAPKAKRK